MELRQIRFFLAVAEERHFGRAAERMCIAQPALLQHLGRLERELGAELFDPSPRRVQLTPAGEAFLEVARRVSRQVDGTSVTAPRSDGGETGSLGLGVHLPVAAPVLSVLLGHWSRLRPAIPPRLTSGRSDELIDLVRRGELDVALVDGPITDRSLRSSLVFETVVAVAAGNGITTQALDFLHLIDTLRRGSRFLPLTTIDLTDPPRGEPAGALGAPRALQRVG